MASKLSTPTGRARRWMVSAVAVPVSAVVLLCVTMAANAADQLPVHGSGLDQNSCVASYDPPLTLDVPVTVPVGLSTDASPQPHNGSLITLSNTHANVSVPGSLVQPAVTLGDLSDGSVVQGNVSVTIAGSNTVEGTHAFSIPAAFTVHAPGGVAQPLTATLALPDTTWTPIDASDAVAFTEQTATVVLHVDLTAESINLTITVACTPSSNTAFVAVAGGTTTTTAESTSSSTGSTTSTTAPTTTTIVTTTTTPALCDRPGWGYGDKNHVHCGPPGRR